MVNIFDIAAKRATVEDQRRGLRGWEAWAIESVKAGASKAHAWTRLPQPWRADLVDELKPLQQQTAGPVQLLKKYHGEWKGIWKAGEKPDLGAEQAALEALDAYAEEQSESWQPVNADDVRKASLSFRTRTMQACKLTAQACGPTATR